MLRYSDRIKTNKVVFYLFGEGLSSMLTRSSAPSWYWEGDAVNLETQIGNFGRGRIPHFTLTTQTNLLDKNKLFDLHSTQASQVYLGLESETVKINLSLIHISEPTRRRGMSYGGVWV